MIRFFTWDEDITEKDGLVMEEFPDKITALAFCDVMGFTYYEHHDRTYNAMQEKDEAIRGAVNRYLEGKSRRIEV